MRDTRDDSITYYIRGLDEKKTPRTHGGHQWRPDSSCWSWRRSIWPRRKARNLSALTAQMKAQCRCDCPPERPPAPLPGCAFRTARTACTLARALAHDMGSECSKDTFGSRSTPQYYHSLGCPLQYPTGFSKFQSDFRLIR
eukprot:scaffold17657_cov131-Isochrysis_galbana.AAC.1